MSMLDDALAQHPDVDEVVNKQNIGLKNEKELKEFDLWIGGGRIGKAPGESDYNPNNPMSKLLEFFGKNGNKRWIIWDQQATWELWQYGLDNCFVYFKKAWRQTEFPPKVHLLTWPVLNLYTQIPTDLYKRDGRDIDIGYYFGALKSNRLSSTRKNIMKAIEGFDWGYNPTIAFFNTMGSQYQAHDFYKLKPMIDGRFNWWLIYMHLLRRTKVIFTSTGFPGFWGADRRSSEAISSGALVFADKPVVQMSPPFEHGKHLFFFDSKSSDEIKDAMELAKSFLSKERKDEREQIAQAGLQHALTYHRSRNYVDYMIEIIKKALRG